MEDRIESEDFIAICKKYSGGDYFVNGSIPRKLLSNAHKNLLIPEGDYVFALVDSTVFGSCKNGLALATRGVYWRNNTSTKPNFVEWNGFLKLDIRIAGKFDIQIGSNEIFSMAGSSFKREDLVELLSQFQKHFISVMENRKRKEMEDAPPSPPPSSSEWMVSISGQQYGPYNINIIQNLVGIGQIKPDEAYVWKPGMPAWVPFSEKFQVNRESMPAMPPVPPMPPRAPMNPTEPPHPDSAPKQAAPNSKYVDVNTATLEDLVEVLGIETIGAKRIIQQRDVVGGFKSVEQIGELLGLKPHHVEKLRQLATFTPLASQAKGGRVID